MAVETLTEHPICQSMRKKYHAPTLLVYGSVQDLTQAGTKGPNEGSGTDPLRRSGSSRHMKENIERIGTHPLGFGLYLFDYRPEFKCYAGLGRQFGVMIDEVVGIVPAAVGTDENGYPGVDYAMLGVHRPMLH